VQSATIRATTPQHLLFQWNDIVPIAAVTHGVAATGNLLAHLSGTRKISLQTRLSPLGGKLRNIGWNHHWRTLADCPDANNQA